MKTLSKTKIFTLIVLLFFASLQPPVVMMTTNTPLNKHNHRISISWTCILGIDKSGVTLQGTGPFTVFAPTNAAFTAFSISWIYLDK
jgi:hypothetical protein